MNRGYIVGAGGQGRVVAENWRAQHPLMELLFIDDLPDLRGKMVGGIPVVGAVAALPGMMRDDDQAVIALGHNPRRLELGAGLPAQWGKVIHPSATVFPSAIVGVGTVIFAGAVVNTEARLGKHVIVNTRAIIEHDSILEDGCSLGPGVSMGGRVHIGCGAFVSAGVTLAPRVRVGEGAVIGAGAVVVKDVPPGVLAYGNPARVVRMIDRDFDWKRLL